jgi:hypothetical protein
MKTSVIISAVLIGISALALTAKVPVNRNESYNPGSFYGLIVNNNANIILSQGEKNSVRIEGEKQATKKVKVQIQDGALVIDGGSDQVNIYITAEDLNMIEVNGPGKILGRGTITSDILLLKVNGSGSMKVDVKSLKVAMILKGDGKLIVSGSTGESYIKESGRGKIYADELYSFTSAHDRVTSNYKKEQL